MIHCKYFLSSEMYCESVAQDSFYCALVELGEELLWESSFLNGTQVEELGLLYQFPGVHSPCQVP